MKKVIAVSIALGGVLAVGAAAPRIDPGSVTMCQANTRQVTVEYTLSDAPAVVTVDVQTNAGNGVWVSVGENRIKSVSGDVNKVVQPGERRIAWDPLADLPPLRLFGGDVTRAVVTAWSLQSPPDYMVIDLSQDVSKDATADNVRYYTSVDALPDGGLANDAYRMTKLVMRRIPAAGATYRMGSPVGEYGRGTDEVPHMVELTNDYYMAIYEYTYAQYGRVNHDASPSSSMWPFSGDSNNDRSYAAFRGSVGDDINWPKTGHAVAATSKIGLLRAHTGIGSFDLPTEAEWEFACRAGTETGWPTGYNASNAAELKVFAVIYDSHSGSRWDVGTLTPNRWGLYDMIGNAAEYCLDWYGDYNVADSLAPRGPESGSARVIRGGYCEMGSDRHFASAARSSRDPALSYKCYGFRLVCDAVAVR